MKENSDSVVGLPLEERHKEMVDRGKEERMEGVMCEVVRNEWIEDEGVNGDVKCKEEEQQSDE